MNKLLMALLAVALLVSTGGCKKDNTTNPDDGNSTTPATGKKWSQLGNLNANYIITSVIADSKGNVYAAGQFTNSNGTYYVAKWNGSTWSDLGNLNAPDYVERMCIDANDNIYVTGSFEDINFKHPVMKWNGSSWIEVAKSESMIANMSVGADNYVYAVGSITNGSIDEVARLSGSGWQSLGIYDNKKYLGAATADKNGIVYAASSRGSLYPGTLEMFNGSWTSLYEVPAGNFTYINACITDKNNNAYFGGDYYNATDKFYAVKWDGAKITKMPGLSGGIQTMCTDKAGNIYAAGSFSFEEVTHNSFQVGKWNGTKWESVGNINVNTSIGSICTDANGNIYAAVHSGTNGFQVYVYK